jgi:hypothetical protein
MIEKVSGSSPSQPPADSLRPLAQRLRGELQGFVDHLNRRDLVKLAHSIMTLNQLSKEAEEC